MPERRGISRREALKWIGLFGAGALATDYLFGKGQILFLANNDLELLSQAKKEAETDPSFIPEIGTLQDFGNETGYFPDPQNIPDRIESVNSALGVEQRSVGIFARMEQFRDETWAENFIAQLNAIHDLGATPVIALQPGYPPGYPGNYLHPFSPESRDWLEGLMRTTIRHLKKFPHKMKIRLFYEMNMPSFVYGSGGGMPPLYGQAHQEGFKLAFRRFDELLREEGIRQRVELIYCPMYHPSWPLDQHYPGKGITDSCGVDLYDYSAIKTSEVFSRRLMAKPSPESMIIPAIYALRRLSGEDPSIEEIGSRTQDPIWLAHAVSLALSLKVSRIMHFDFDKRKLGEWDFTLTSEIVEAYREILKFFNK